MEGNNMRKIFLLMLGCLGFSSLATAEVNANTGTTPPFNPGIWAKAGTYGADGDQFRGSLPNANAVSKQFRFLV